MAGTINSLGIGSGVLTADVIDKLKANDTSNIIAPLDRKITLNQQKTQALDLLSSLLTSFKGNVNSLSDDVLYQKRTVSGNNDGVSVTALSGTAVQSFSISNVQLAKKDVVESGSFATAQTSIVNAATLADPLFTAGTLQVSIDGTTYDISYDKNSTLESIKTAINDAVGTKLTASILQTGASAYNLVLTSKETGVDQAITLSDLNGGLVDQLGTGLQTIQGASDATFNYNGIPITRSTNTIDDLIDSVTHSVTINLLQDNASSNISISQDQQVIADELKSLTTAYNTLIKQLDDMTLTDLENGKVGIFNGDNSIKSIKREITKMITSVDLNGNSLAQYGIGLSQDGTMTFTQSEFDTKIAADPTGLEAFFSGATDSDGNYTEGVFGNLDALIASYTSTNGFMSTLSDSSDNELKSLNSSKARSQALLDARYDAMAARFAQYDSMISKLNSQFSSLQQQIDAMANNDN